APLFPQRPRPGKAGRPPCDDRAIVNGSLWVLHCGEPWRDLPEYYGPWETVFCRFNAWRRDGTWVRIVTSLLDELDDKGLLDHDLWCVDGTVVRASRAAAGAGKKGRGTRVGWAGARGRLCESLRTMPWGVRAAGSGRRAPSSATGAGSSGRSPARPARRTRARRSSRGGPIDSSIAAVAVAAGRATWRVTRATVIQASDAGVAGDGSRRSSRRARTSRVRSTSTRRRTGGEIS